MGAPAGNQNAAKARIWTAAIERALAKRSKVERTEMLDALADALIDMALAKNLQALQEIGNRLEGKPDQNLNVTSRRAEEMSDDDLYRVASGGSDRATETQSGPEVPPSVH